MEIVETTIERIEKLNESTKAYITILKDEALEAARLATEEIRQGNYKGPLHGIPVGIKDNYETDGILTTGGSKIYKDNVPEQTSFAVKNLLDAGAIMVGKLNLHPLGFGLTGTNPSYGDAVNPWNVKYMTGSSSSGSATALGGGMAYLVTGSDTFGSIRVPSSMSGIYGIKPTYGLISAAGLMPLAPSLDMAGPMARTLEDCALMLTYMAKNNPEDPLSYQHEEKDYTKTIGKSIEGFKIAVPQYFLDRLESIIAERFEEAIEKLKEAGAEVEVIDVPELELVTYAEYVTLIAESSSYNIDVLQDEELIKDFEQDPRVYSLAGTTITSDEYIKAQQARRIITDALKDVLDRYDVIVAPTIPIKSEPYQENYMEQNLDIVEKCVQFTGVASTTGLPCLSTPMALDDDGMPIGLQIIGKHFDEQTLFQVAGAYDKKQAIR